MKKWSMLFSALVLLISAALAGCGQTATPATEEPTEALRVAAVLPGRVDDGQFNQQMYEGLLAIKDKLGDQVEIAWVEGVYEVVDIEPALRDYAEQGYDLILGHGFQFQDPIMAVAPDYPEVHFAIGPGAFLTADNVSTYHAEDVEVGYALGAIAGLVTKTNILGSVGGLEVPNVVATIHGIQVGSKAVNQDAEVKILYVGSFEDVEGGRASTSALIDEGADVIYGAMNNASAIMEETETRGVYGVMSNDVSATYPKSALASVRSLYVVAIEEMLNDIQTGSFGNKSYLLTFQNGGLLFNVHQEFDQTTQDDIDAVINGLVDGSTVIPEQE